MIIIGEKINGTFKSVGRAIDKRDARVLQDLAIKQLDAGANILDISTGPGLDNPAEAMVWMVNVVQDVTDKPLAIDTPIVDVMKAGVEAAKNKVVLNSCTAIEAKMNALFPLAKEHDAEVICVTLNEQGIPNEPVQRCELAMQMITKAMEYEIPTDKLYLDPIILPVGAAQDQCAKVFETLTMFKTLCEPPPKTIVGLSNISNGTKERPLINRTYLAMLMAYGLDGAILNPLDQDLMAILKTADIIMNKKLYCDDYLRA
jgi:5-methyltetrahydrofolate corrinoid/iron sulfur protein methyltransferase